MAKRLVIDLMKCEGCEACSVSCGYFYRPPGAASGIHFIKERATYQVVCRRCEHASCVAACPYEALERQPDGVIKRHPMRCVSCKLCTQACPFGTIYPEMVGFYVTPCEACLGPGTDDPPCVWGCTRDAVSYREVDPGEEHLHLVDEHLAVIASRWEKANV